MKRSLRMLRTVLWSSLLSTLLVTFSIDLWAVAGQEKPTTEELVTAVKRTVGGMVGPSSGIWAAGAANGFGLGFAVEVLDVEVLRYGQYNEANAYLPAELCVLVKGWDPNRETLNQAFPGAARSSEKRFGAKLQVRLSRDDFGDWRGAQIPPQRGEPVGNSMCSFRGGVGAARADAVASTSPSSNAEIDSRVEATKPDTAAPGFDWGAMRAKYPNVEQAFRVKHNHQYTLAPNRANDVWMYCEGLLFGFADRVRYEAVTATDGQVHLFDATLAELREVKKNFGPVGIFSAFHIRLTSGKNYDFVPEGRYPDVNGVVRAIEALRERK